MAAPFPPPAGMYPRFFRVGKIGESPSSGAPQLGLVPLNAQDGARPIPGAALGFYLDDYPEGTILELRPRGFNLEREKEPPPPSEPR